MHQKAFTLIEILIILAVLGVIFTIVIGPIVRYQNNQALQNTTNTLVAVLSDARTKTLAALNNTFYSVHLENNQATLFVGATYTVGAITNEVVLFEDPITATWSLQGGGSDIVFDHLKGTTSNYGTITLSLSSVETKTITINALGTIVRN